MEKLIAESEWKDETVSYAASAKVASSARLIFMKPPMTPLCIHR